LDTDMSATSYAGEKTARIVSLYRADRGLTQEDFAAALTEKLTDDLTKQAVSLWEAGLRQPNHVFCLRLGILYEIGDWRSEMGIDLLAALLPEAYKPVGKIGKHVLLGEPLGALEVQGMQS